MSVASKISNRTETRCCWFDLHQRIGRFKLSSSGALIVVFGGREKAMLPPENYHGSPNSVAVIRQGI